MFNQLDASNFTYNKYIYNVEFENVLNKIITCYQIMIKDGVKLPNNENDIRDILVNKYINNPIIKKALDFNYFVFPEVPETQTTGRTDIRLNHPGSVFNQNEEYYIIECKRLDKNNQTGLTGLNAKYIENGICRFTTNYYSSYYQVNGMIGFVVEDMDIDENVKYINKLIPSFSDSFCDQEIEKNGFVIKDDFEYSYTSTHSINNKNRLLLYHLMLECF